MYLEAGIPVRSSEAKTKTYRLTAISILIRKLLGTSPKSFCAIETINSTV